MAKVIKQKGSTVRIWGIFSDPDTNEPVDPNTVELTIKFPDSEIVAFSYPDDVEIIRDETGSFYYALSLDQAGTHHWRWIGSSGDIAAAIVGELDSVETTDFTEPV